MYFYHLMNVIPNVVALYLINSDIFSFGETFILVMNCIAIGSMILHYFVVRKIINIGLTEVKDTQKANELSNKTYRLDILRKLSCWPAIFFTVILGLQGM